MKAVQSRDPKTSIPERLITVKYVKRRTYVGTRIKLIQQLIHVKISSSDWHLLSHFKSDIYETT